MRKPRKVTGHYDIAADKVQHTTRYDAKVFHALSKHCEDNFLALSWQVNEIVKKHFGIK